MANIQWFAFAGTVLGCMAMPAQAETRRPNVVFILADDLGYMDIGANYPQTFYETPNINRLAAQGMRFTEGYAACPVCSPTRASILTGKYPARLHLTNYIGGGKAGKLKPAPFVGRLVLEEVTQNTIVMFMSDNGGLSTSEGSPTSNLPLLAGKGWLYEGGIREPMLIKAPGVTKAGALCNTPVISTDFYPTILELAGLPLKPKQHLDGVGLLPLLKGAALPQRPLFWHYPHYSNQGGGPCGAVRLGDMKLIEWYEDDRVELYNLKNDLGENNDLAAKMPDKAAALRTMLHDWRKTVNATMPTKPD